MINRRTLVTVAGAVALAPAAHAQRGPYWDSRASMPWAIQEIYAAVMIRSPPAAAYIS